MSPPTTSSAASLTVVDPRDDDLAIARRIAAGDRAAFIVLMRRHNRRLYRLARATLRDDAEAEDALQEAYLAAYRSIAKFRGDAYANKTIERLRSQREIDSFVERFQPSESASG